MPGETGKTWAGRRNPDRGRRDRPRPLATASRPSSPEDLLPTSRTCGHAASAQREVRVRSRARPEDGGSFFWLAYRDWQRRKKPPQVAGSLGLDWKSVVSGKSGDFGGR